MPGVRRRRVAAVRLLQREEEQRQVGEQPKDLPPLPHLQSRRVHPVREVQGLQVHHVPGDRRHVIQRRHIYVQQFIYLSSM